MSRTYFTNQPENLTSGYVLVWDEQRHVMEVWYDNQKVEELDTGPYALFRPMHDAMFVTDNVRWAPTFRYNHN